MSNVPNDLSSSIHFSEASHADLPVAVIAIHGVGQHPEGASAEAVSTLLTSLPREAADKTPAYDSFAIQYVEVALEPVRCAPEGHNDSERNLKARSQKPSRMKNLFSKAWNMFDERRGFLCEQRKVGVTEARRVRGIREEPHVDRSQFGYEFMRSQLAHYAGDNARVFTTLRLEGSSGANHSGPKVHIYDAHYSDLSKQQNGVVGFFFALYQLLFHLASLSLQAVYWAEAENSDASGKVGRWRVLASLHATSIRMLIMWVPILNLVLLGLGVCTFVERASSTFAMVAGLSFAAILGIVMTFRWRGGKSSPARPTVWASIPLGGALIGVTVSLGIAWLYQFLLKTVYLRSPVAEPLNIGTITLLFAVLAIVGFGIFWVTQKFEEMRPGAFWLSIPLFFINAIFFLFVFLPKALKLAGTSDAIATASLWSVQWVFGQLSICWVICLVCAFVTWPIGKLCQAKIKNADQKGRAAAALRTGRLAFALPGLLFLIVTLALWTAIVVTGSEKLHAFDKVKHETAAAGPTSWFGVSYFIPNVCYLESWMDHANHPVHSRIMRRKDALADCHPALLAPQTLTNSRERGWDTYLRGLLLVSITPGLPVTLFLLSLGIFLLTWAVFPSLLYESSLDPFAKAGKDDKSWLGSWLSRGLDSTTVVTRLLWTALVPVPIIFGIMDWLVWMDIAPEEIHRFVITASRVTLPILQQASIAITATAIYGIGLKYMGKILDTLLDVDNYLRTSPKYRTPRATIAERITSLLRHIGNYRDSSGRPYGRVIIVAHSLGTMVSSDLLQYLHRSAADSPDPALAAFGFGQKEGEARTPIYLMTMGSPLRQLMNRFFPHLYWWISDTPDNSLHPEKNEARAAEGDFNGFPRAEDLRVKGWMNLYRSGDYVGRSLWTRQKLAADSGPVMPVLVDAKRQRAEVCIGLGAHTHYWDRGAPDVGRNLQILITNPEAVFGKSGEA
jgi:hypothetical protein